MALPRPLWTAPPAATSGPEILDGDMRPADIADALARLRFRNGPLLIQLDREARNYLLASVRARIGERR
jgi:hypothetical protein